MGITVYPPQIKTYNIQYFPASSTFTLPTTGINQFDCLLVAGGGGGGRVNNVNYAGQGGMTSMVYFQNTYCTNGSVLTITVGAGGAGSTTLATGGSNGSATSISGLTGNGVSNTLTTGIGQGGSGTYALTSGYNSPNLGSWNGSFLNTNAGNTFANNLFGSGMASYAGAAGTDEGYSYTSHNLWNGTTYAYVYNQSNQFLVGGNGAAAPLLGSYLHSATGGTGTAGTSAGGACSANTFFAGSGGSGGNNNLNQTNGCPTYGGGGGGGGQSATGGTLAGNGGNASANSGGGGGGGGGNMVTAANSGNGGNGGSGFAIIGWWG